MQRALQLAENGAVSSGQTNAPKKKDVRAATIRAIHATWRKVAFDLEDDELRDARIAFINNTLKLNPPIESMRDKRMTSRRLGLVLDDMRELERGNRLPFSRLFAGERLLGKPVAAVTSNPEAYETEIHHLATGAQVEAIDKLFVHLGWSAGGIEKFLEGKFHRKSQRLLTPAQANSCTMILFNIAASREIRARGAAHASRQMIRVEIPRLKARLGIDVKKSADSADEENQ